MYMCLTLNKCTFFVFNITINYTLNINIFNIQNIQFNISINKKKYT